jgi:hypothetical protein
MSFFCTSGTRVMARGGFGGDFTFTGFGGFGNFDGPRISALIKGRQRTKFTFDCPSDSFEIGVRLVAV